MKPRGERDLSQQELAARLTEKAASIPGVQAFVSEVPAFGGERGEPLQLVLRGRNLADVARYADQIRERLLATAGMGSCRRSSSTSIGRVRRASVCPRSRSPRRPTSWSAGSTWRATTMTRVTASATTCA